MNFFLERIANLVKLFGLTPIIESTGHKDFRGLGMWPVKIGASAYVFERAEQV